MRGKPDRDAQIWAQKQAGKTLQEIGAHFQLTRERVRQILALMEKELGQRYPRRTALNPNSCAGKARALGLTPAIIYGRKRRGVSEDAIWGPRLRARKQSGEAHG